MERTGHPYDAASFLCSPIPRDPTQLLFVGDSTPMNAQEATRKTDSIFDPEADQMTGRQSNGERMAPASSYSFSTPNQQLTSIHSQLGKRPRIEAESAAIIKSEQLGTEVQSLRLQLEHRTESQQIQLKERDLQLSQLRRQLQYAVAEEEHTRQELKTLTSEYANEKLQLQKKAVELESKLQFVESSFSEWREKADDTVNELRTAARQSKLKIQLLTDELDAAKSAAAAQVPRGDTVLESKVKLLEVSLRDKDLQVQHAEQRLQNASMTLESSKDVRSLKDRIVELESHERRLKQELVEFIDSSRRSAVQDEKLNQMRQKLQVMEQRYAAAQQEIDVLNMRQQSSQTASSKLEGEQKRMDAEIVRLKSALAEAAQSERNYKRQMDTSVAVANELQLKAATATGALSAMQKVNEELVAILQTYKNHDDNNGASSAVLARLTSVLEDASPLVKQLDALSVSMLGSSASCSGKAYEDEITRLKDELKVSHDQSSRLATQLGKVERECAELEKRVGRGEYNAETTKVVHLAVNPTSELVGAKQAAAPSTPMDSMTTPAATLTTTTSYETVEGQKLLNQRLKEVFQNQIQQYREAVYQLTGYKVDLKKSNGMELLRLRSMYADHDDDELLVRMEPNGGLELLETNFCGQINKRVFAYLTTCRSFPAFLSTLTLHLFEKQTFQGN